MSGVGLRVDGIEASAAALARGSRQAGNMRGLYDQIGASLADSTRRRFDNEQAPDGSPWPPSMRALAEGGKTLTDTARLKTSITFEADDTGVSVGTNVVYAAIHQLGGDIHQAARQQVIHFKRKRGGRVEFAKANKKATFAQKVSVGERTIHMPARPFLGLDQDDNAEIVALTGDWLIGPKGIDDAPH